MDRRTFLRSVLTGAAGAAAFPAFAAVPVTDAEGLALLTTAWKRAAGRPILVLIVPSGDDATNHGQPLGAWLNHGGDAVWTTLAQTEVVCVTKRHVELFAGAVDWPEDPWFAIIDTRAVPATVQALDLQLPPIPPDRIDVDVPDDLPYAERARRFERAWADAERREEAAVDAQIDTIQAAVARAVARFHLPRPTADTIEETRQRVLVKPPPGAEWANGGGCGIDIEGQENNFMIGCGMGHVPVKSTRFLYFYALHG